MAYIAVKPCRFAGQNFKVGERVPAAALQPGAAHNLVKMGIIAREDDTEAGAETVTVEVPAPITLTIAVGNEEVSLEPSLAGLQSVVDVLMATVQDAEPIVNAMTDDDALILLDAVDSRKSIKDLAEARATALSTPAEDPDPEETPGE